MQRTLRWVITSRYFPRRRVSSLKITDWSLIQLCITSPLESTSRFILSASPVLSGFMSFTCQSIFVIIATLIIHYSFTFSFQAQNLSFQQSFPPLHRWGEGGAVTSVGWQITLCDPIDKWRPVVLRWISRRTIRSFFTFFTLLLCPLNCLHDDHATGPYLSAHQFIFVVFFSFTFLFIPCGRLSWLSISFLLHVKYTIVSYRMSARS